MKKSKKRLLIISLLIGLIVLGIIAFYFISNLNNENSLTLKENKWIDSNKYNVIDIALMNDIPTLSYNGDGLAYDYLNYVTDKLSLKFNIVPYKFDGTTEYNIKMEMVDKVTDKEITLLEDNMILVTVSDIEYNDVKEIDNIRLGVLSEDKDILSNYFTNKNIELVEYNTYTELKQAMNEAKVNYKSGIVTTIDGIVLPKTIYTKEIIENNYKISFKFNDLNKYFVLSLNSDEELNSILQKNYNIWKEKKYEESYNNNLVNDYFNFKNISDVEQKKLKSKSYVYGFINYGIINILDSNKISGVSGLLLKDFNKFSGLSITYTKYNSVNRLLKDFNSKKVDFILNIVDNTSHTNDIYNTAGVFNKNLAIISGISNNYTIDNVYSLKDKEVLVVKDTYLEKYLINNGAKVKAYNNMSDLVKDYDSSDITIVDLENYNYYKTSAFKDSKINYLIGTSDKYDYIINNTDENKVFQELFNFYISYNSINELISNNYESIAYENTHIVLILVLIIIVLCIYLAIDFYTHIKVMIKTVKKNKKIHLSKEEKIKYIDQLTSLKNRAYLNSRIESWDESEVYPQSIIIIDLNNISYINDNYGREEGDKVITEAANILIMHQLGNSEIIRTDGNEFLIYLVGYTEKQIISYLRKLNKELKGISHGFGAATGYSIITDAIKTVDDAVNEATIDMKNNKEDIDY